MLTNKEAVEQLRNLKKANFYSSTIIALDMAIDALKQTTWIQVGERLPDVRGQIVMVTLKGDLVSRDFLRADGEPEWYGWGDEVIAWMPIPKPYKGGDDNGKD